MATFSTDFMMEMMDGNVSEVKEIAKMLLALGPEMIDEIGLAIKNEDWVVAGDTAHKLKTSLKMWRMDDIIDIAILIEKNGRNNINHENILEDFDKLKKGFENAILGLKNQLEI